LRDGSQVPLLRSAGEIAVMRAKALSQQMVSQNAAAEKVVVSMGAADAPNTQQFEIYSVKDAARGLSALSALDGVAWASPVLAVPGSGKRVVPSDELIVQFDAEAATNGVSESILKELATRGLEVAESPLASAQGHYLLRSRQGQAEATLAEAYALAQRAGVAWSEPNFLVELELYSTPNDPFFAWQQSLHNTGQNGATPDADVDAPEAWDVRTGDERLVIAIINTGVDTGHPDLRIFRNDTEWGDGRENNGIDDDGNGYVDDYQGWDFYGLDNNPNPGPSAAAAHGTSCAGVAAAKGNNGIGISGAAQRCTILPIKIVSDDGGSFAYNYRIGQAIRYAAQYADVISCSWGGFTESSEIDSAIDCATTSGRAGRGCAVFVASGNECGWWEIKPRRIPCIVPSAGDYRFGFKALALSSITGPEWLAVDQSRILSADGYTSLWRRDFEDGQTAGWTTAHGGGVTADWSLAYTPYSYDYCWRPGSSDSVISPDFNGQSAGAWAELHTPSISLQQGTVFISFMSFRMDGWNQQPLNGQVWLLDANGQPLQLLNDERWARNGNYSGLAYPASYVNSIAVGACTDLDLRSFYSRYQENSPSVFCVAPSHGGWNAIVSTDTRGTSGVNTDPSGSGDYRMEFGGTSAATPLAAGVATLVLSKNANLTLQQLKDSLRLGCDKIGGVTYDGNGWHPEYGYGRVNAYNSLQNAPSDTIAPTLLSVVTRTSRAVEVTFSEPMGYSAMTAANYTITGAGKGTLADHPTSVKWVSGNTFLLEWTGGEMVEGTGNITVRANSNVKDIAGNSIGSPNSGAANGSRVIYQLNCGPRYAESSYPISPFESERFWSGVGTLYGQYPLSNVLDNDGTPDAVYGSERCVLCQTTYPGDITYTFPGISSGVNHTVRLYFFTNGYSTYAGDVRFTVYLNNVSKLSNFDLIGAAGGTHVGLWMSFRGLKSPTFSRVKIPHP
jgi:subtilisin family serine protease